MIDSGGYPQWMRDGQGLVYHSAKDRQIHLFEIPANRDRRITDEPNVMPIYTVSPDGKWLIYQSTMKGNVDLRAIPIEGGAPRDVVTSPRYEYHPFCSPSGKWLYFHLDHKNLYRVPGPAQDFRPAAPERVTNFPESGLLLEDIQISRDGRQLLFSRGRLTGDVWILNLGQ